MLKLPTYDQGVRQLLNQKGIDNNRIGYNVDSGTVTVDGKDFLKPQKNASGTTFTDTSSFDNAYNTFTGKPVTPKPQPQATPSNPYDSQVSNTLTDLLNRINNPQSYDPYSSAEYKASEAQQQRAAQQGIRTAQESLGASGFARSTNVSDRAQRIQNDSNEYLQTQVVPQLMAAKRASDQQELGNLMNMLGVMTNQQGVYDTRDQNKFNNEATIGQLTGYFQHPEAKKILNEVADWKRIAEDPTTTEAGRTEASKQADALRALLPQYGIDPSIVGSGVNLDTALKNIMSAGKTTLAKQAQDYNIFDTNRKFTEGQRQFDTQTEQTAKQFAEKMGLEWASLNQRDKESVAQLAISQQNANTAAGNLELAKSEFSYKKTNTGKEIDPKTSASNYSDAVGELGNAKTREQARQFIDANIDNFNDADYRRALEYIDELYPQ